MRASGTPDLMTMYDKFNARYDVDVDQGVIFSLANALTGTAMGSQMPVFPRFSSAC
jgi:hypothetical protein